MVTYNSNDQHPGDDAYIEGVDGDGGRLAQGFVNHHKPTNGDIAAQRLGEATEHRADDTSKDAQKEAALLSIAGLAGGTV